MTKADKRENIIMIASEPLTFERSDWLEVKTNTMIVITPKVSRSTITPLLMVSLESELTSDESLANTYH